MLWGCLDWATSLQHFVKVKIDKLGWWFQVSNSSVCSTTHNVVYYISNNYSSSCCVIELSEKTFLFNSRQFLKNLHWQLQPSYTWSVLLAFDWIWAASVAVHTSEFIPLLLSALTSPLNISTHRLTCPSPKIASTCLAACDILMISLKSIVFSSHYSFAG